jgi:uncharacterized repeat protein (TIGR03803 family)
MKIKILGIILGVLTCGFVNAQTYMYGTTSEGGANNKGTIYRVDENGQNFENVFDFSASTGGTPLSGLTLGDNGKLYGFTTTDGQVVNAGASLAFGSFYEFDPQTAAFNVIEYIDDKSSIGDDFRNSPTKGNNGMLYFSSEDLGIAEMRSVVSSYDVNTNTLTALDTLSLDKSIRSKLLFATDNKLYATTFSGGTGSGSIVQFDVSNNTLTEIHTSPGIGASTPGYKHARNNPLFEASNGVLYGASVKGGLSFEFGNVFKINKDGTGYQSLEEFAGSGVSDEGFWPEGGFYEKNGKIFFTTPEEDVSNLNGGVIYSINISNNSVIAEHTLDDAIEGARPRGGIIESPNGRLYFTCNGENLNNGSLVEYNVLTGAVTKRHSFSPSDGTKPYHDGLCFVDFSALSINESSLLDNIVKAYPNPFQDVVNIKVEESHLIETIKILDMKGSELYINNSMSNEYNLNTSFLSSGVYLLYIQTDLGSTTRKIKKNN